jgi:hypothetical protein
MNRINKSIYLLLKGYNKQFYCKFHGSGDPGNLWYTFYFGGKSTYCITIAMKGNPPTEAYMSRVEYDAKCIKDAPLEKNGGTAKLLSISLWVIKTFFPSIEKITFMDDSHIECIQGSKLKKMSLACDYMLKYGMTWYEKLFHATLPDDLNPRYKSSLPVLEQPLEDFEYQVGQLPSLEKYKDKYLVSTSPKHFFEQLRKQYGSNYCEEVCNWIHMYIRLLNVDWSNSNWFIPAETIVKPPGFSMGRVENPFKGGKYTRKRRKSLKYDVPSIGSYEGDFI